MVQYTVLDESSILSNELVGYVGIDPGIANCGVAFVDNDGVIVRVSTIKNKNVSRTIVADCDRANVICRRLRAVCCSVLREWNVCDYTALVAVVEGPAFARISTLSIQTGILHKSIYDSLRDLVSFSDNNYVITVPPKVLKKFSTGNGNASKRVVRECAYDIFGIELESQDAVEASLLAMFGHCFVNNDPKAVVFANKVSAFYADNCRCYMEVNPSELIRGYTSSMSECCADH